MDFVGRGSPADLAVAALFPSLSDLFREDWPPWSSECSGVGEKVMEDPYD